ncbi:MAG: hypothetical protein H0W76_17000 [Pyrinomonadaceae bacterium]|nr:hypothetical protein [Pyrinomonadaceae bacterium]
MFDEDQHRRYCARRKFVARRTPEQHQSTLSASRAGVATIVFVSIMKKHHAGAKTSGRVRHQLAAPAKRLSSTFSSIIKTAFGLQRKASFQPHARAGPFGLPRI